MSRRYIFLLKFNIYNEAVTLYWAAYYMVAFGNTRVSFCVVKWLLLLLPLLFPPPIVQVFISLRTLISHCPLVRSLAPASLWCSFQHPHISPATCKGLTCDAWHFALPSQHARSTSVLVLWVAWCPHCVKGRVPQVKTCTGAFCKLAALLHVLAAQQRNSLKKACYYLIFVSINPIKRPKPTMC